MSLFRSTRLTGLVGVVLAGLLATSGTALAGDPTPPPPPTSSGKVGTFQVIESEDTPSAVCSYNDPDGQPDVNNFLYRLAVKAPKVKAAKNRTSQTVAWRLNVQTWNGDVWVSFKRSTWTSATARGTTAAPLADRSLRLRTWDSVFTTGWRAKVEIRWYGTDGTTITGRAAIWPTWYTFHWLPFPDQLSPFAYCSWTTG